MKAESRSSWPTTTRPTTPRCWQTKRVRRLALDYRAGCSRREQGKHHALNAALTTVTTPLVVTVDADTHLQQQSLARDSWFASPAHRKASTSAPVAAALVAENSHATFVTRMQQWDYRLGINGVKRMQAAYNTALVAQGAFSAYWTSDLRGGLAAPMRSVKTSSSPGPMLGSRGIVQYEPVALGFTVVPERLGRLLSQRSRWARGMFEGLRTHPPSRQPPVLAKLVAGIDYLVPCLDIGVILFWVPGVILFLFGYPLIFGWWSMLLLPITLAVFGFLQRWQASHVFRALDIHPQPDKRGFIGYLLAYQVLTSAAALRGYSQYLVGSGRRWK